MIKITSVTELRQIVESNSDSPVGFVPTMGWLHEGHLSLVKKSMSENKLTGLSIFVNPLQFNQEQDFINYPQNIQKDIDLLKSIGFDGFVFHPQREELLKTPIDIAGVDLGSLEKSMEAVYRPGHFDGVLKIVKKLFEVVTPQKVYFGEKDFQQLKIIQKLVFDLNMPIDIVPCETVRTDAGLAMSSRNARLSPEQLKKAPIIYEQLQFIRKGIKNGLKFASLKEESIKKMESENFKVEYITLASEKSLIEKTDLEPGCRVFVAVFVGDVRLIDNISCS